ncbi:elongation of very long chain fatty acids protein AAEL008004-like [Topomyia yanbarensis]|uniref:elongation of very long chain fatty acids protein AAEL008004-like n=1 Tax=Topomyia yanbarensis TaxID=2498891 RepID=UPI00273B23CA|nr:elongation of very long chain fatty acids protein AAEL008004-like [Topomyia yanbarensis]
MALVLKSLYQHYNYYYHDAQDPRTTDLVLMNPPWMPLALIASYMYFVQSLGPRLMANRKAFELRQTLLMYNILQVILNIYLAYAGTKLMIEKRVSLLCEPVDRSLSETAVKEVQLVHYYYLLKVLDLVDTVFFVLRKKQSHVSFLHVYHHAGMALVPFFYARIYPGGHGSMLGVINVYVHAAMYFYFFLTVYRPELTKNARWKKYITVLQMVQFAVLAVYFGLPVLLNYECGIPNFWFCGVLIQCLFMLAMFGDFYRKAYGRKKEK